LEDLKPRVENWSPTQCLGDIFLTITNYLKVYTSYVQHYDDALEVLSECKKKSKFLHFLEDARENDAGGQDIEALLILPIQRIPRYNLLLSQLVKYTWKDHIDYPFLEAAYEKMTEVANYVNEKKREFENVAKVREIQAAFDGKVKDLVDPSRKWVRSDVVAIWSGSNDTDKKQSELILTLFNDLLVVSNPSSKRGTLKLKETLKLSHIHFKEPKARKWSIKKNEMGKFWPTRKISNASDSKPISPSNSSDSVGSDGSQKRDSFGSRDSWGLRDVFGSPGRRNSSGLSFSGLRRKSSSGHSGSLYSVRNTVELVNSKGESRLKVCFESPLEQATWISDFKRAKEELDKRSKNQSDKTMLVALQKAEDTKKVFKRWLPHL